MTRHLPALTLALLAAGAPFLAHADDGAPPAPTKGEQLAARQFKWLDTNGDGKLSYDEVSMFPRIASVFDSADTNRDGFLTFEELRDYAAQQRAKRDAEAAAAAKNGNDAKKQ